MRAVRLLQRTQADQPSSALSSSQREMGMLCAGAGACYVLLATSTKAPRELSGGAYRWRRRPIRRSCRGFEAVAPLARRHRPVVRHAAGMDASLPLRFPRLPGSSLESRWSISTVRSPRVCCIIRMQTEELHGWGLASGQEEVRRGLGTWKTMRGGASLTKLTENTDFRVTAASSLRAPRLACWPPEGAGDGLVI